MEAMKKDLGEYYYCIVNILVTLPYMNTSSRDGGGKEESGSSGDEDEPKATCVDAGGED